MQHSQTAQQSYVLVDSRRAPLVLAAQFLYVECWNFIVDSRRAPLVLAAQFLHVEC